ncbi:two-component regulator propeller domain-containing protein [Parahaliea aestuarii]|nr:two-component regulator propeller domain-containing protein [Parahaliea aestuarii]
MRYLLKLLCLSPLLLSTPVSASISEADITVSFHPAVFANDLTQKTVSQIFQDSTGAIWFASLEGLNRYNGHELENFRYSPGNPGSLSSDNVTGIEEDNEGTIWISTIGGGLNRFDSTKNSFSALYADKSQTDRLLSNDINTIFKDSSGRIWVGHSNAFSSFDPKTERFDHYISDKISTPPLGEVISFSQSTDGTIWIATSEAGILKVDTISRKILPLKANSSNDTSPPTNNIIDTMIDSQNRLWVASSTSGVGFLNLRTNERQNFNHQASNLESIPSNSVFEIFEDKNGFIWLGTQEGLCLFNEKNKGFIRINTTNANLPSDPIYSIFQSSEGQYWIGTYDGLATGTRLIFPTYNEGNTNLSSDSINAFSETGDGSFWVGTDNGLNRLRPNHQNFEWINQYTFPSISSGKVMSLLGEENTIWVGTFDEGLNRIDLENNQVEVFRKNEGNPNSIPANGITSIIRGTDKNIYIGTFGGGLSIYDERNGTFTNYQYKPGDTNSLSSNKVIAIYEDSLGTIWIGTESGLNGFDPERKTFIRMFSERGNAKSLSNDMVWAFYEDKNGDLWLGTNGGGLNRWSLEKRSARENYFDKYANNSDFPSSHIYGIQPSQEGGIWLSHNNGASLLNPSTGRARHFGIRDGLQDREFNLGASYQKSDGSILFGGNRGYNLIDDDNYTNESEPPKVSISEIRIMNQRMKFDEPYNSIDQLNLGYRDIMVSIEFFAAHYTNPDLIKYAYKLDGINTDWVVSESSRVATFTTLPAGEYTLRLAAATPSGVWNWDAVQLPIVVSPPPWLSKPAYAIYTFFVLLLLSIPFYRSKRQSQLAKKRQAELEAKVVERTKDLEDARKVAERANRAKSEFLATISHEIRTPLHGMIGMTDLLLHTTLNSQQRKFADAARSSGAALLSLINDILDFSKIEAKKAVLERTTFNLPELVEDACFLQAVMARRKGVQLQPIIDTPYQVTCVGDPTKIRQILTNLISNAVKFTHAGHVNVSLSLSEYKTDTTKSIVEFTITDTGIGMDSNTLSRIFDPFTQADASTTREYGGTGLGLTICQQYIELMEGNIDIQSRLGEGTRISITIPLEVSCTKNFSGELRFKKSIIYSSDSIRKRAIESQLSRLLIEPTPKISERNIFSLADSDTLIVVDLSSHNFGTDQLGDFELLDNVILITSDEIDEPWGNSSLPVVESPISSGNLLKAIEALENRREKEWESPLEALQSTQCAKILVAEDVETNQRIIKEMLELLGHNVIIAENGRRAVEIFRTEKIDLIFMDCQMPILDGFGASKLIRDYESSRGLSQTPIIALSAGASVTDIELASNAGMNHYISKPYNLDDLSSSISDYCVGYNGKAEKTNPRCSEIQSKKLAKPNLEANPELIIVSAIDNIRSLEDQTGRKILPTIFDGYRNQFEEKILELKKANELGDISEIYKTSHAIKSMSANIGAAKVRKLASEIEDGSRSGEACNYSSAIDHLELAHLEFNRYFRENFLIQKNNYL